MASSGQLLLPPKEIAFIQHPDALTEPGKAALDVGYSESFAKNKSFDLRAKHLPVLVERMRTTLEKLAITPDWVQNEVAILARTAPTDFIEFIEDDKGNQYPVLRPRASIPDDKWRAAIKEMEFEDMLDTKTMQLRSRVTKLKFYDRQKAIMDLAILLGLTSEKVMAARAMASGHAKTEEEQMLESMEPEDLEEIVAIQERVLARVRAKASRKRDRNAIVQK